MKIQTNEKTIEAIKGIVADQDQKNVRIYIAGMSCSGPSFGLTLDDVHEYDVTNDEHGLTFIMSKEHYDQSGDMIVELVEGGYMVKPITPIGGGCSSCAGSCG